MQQAQAKTKAVILNAQPAAWAFDEHARRLSRAIGVEVSEQPADFNYVLGWPEECALGRGRSFVPLEAVRIASDKRMLAGVFASHGVPTPRTHLVNDRHEVLRLVALERDIEWCLKWPIACGASGHRLINSPESVPEDWPRPYVVQEFIRLDEPTVFRTYAAGGDIFGWNVRQFPAGVKKSAWVAHAHGARYTILGDPPANALNAARQAMEATGLLGSFGCADLMQGASGEWIVLEVGTDGVFNHVDRDLENLAFQQELDRRLAKAFWRWVANRKR
jgi:hypothetical protein